MHAHTHTETRLGLKELTLDVSFSSYRGISEDESLGLSVLCENREERDAKLPIPDLLVKLTAEPLLSYPLALHLLLCQYSSFLNYMKLKAGIFLKYSNIKGKKYNYEYLLRTLRLRKLMGGT